ncbi:hypothetical protein M5689_022673 [Euphorbia peplus]|nr:hypothetical protein M5689_022673 [Euphorbia peplus]
MLKCQKLSSFVVVFLLLLFTDASSSDLQVLLKLKPSVIGRNKSGGLGGLVTILPISHSSHSSFSGQNYSKWYFFTCQVFASIEELPER